MKVFITGASGYCGKEIVRELVAHGHQVRGLSRSEAGADAVNKLGAVGVFGDSNDLDLIKRESSQADGFIHCAFDHSFTDMPGACAKEQAVIDTVCELYAGTQKVIVFTSAVPAGQGINLDEDSEVTVDPHKPRGGAEVIARKWRAKGVRIVGVRLPLVHGGDMHQGNFWLIPVNADMKAGFVATVNGGNNVFAHCHVYDVARLFVAVLENPEASAFVHAVQEGNPTKELAAASAAQLGFDVKDLTMEQAPAHFGWFAMFISVDIPGNSKKTQERLPWAPRERSLLQALKDGDPAYFHKF